jgi:glycogen(starch) synthase
MPAANNSGSTPRHVLMTVDAVGGVWTYALELCRALGRFHVRVSLAALGPSASAGQRAALRHLKNVELFEGGYPLEWMEGAEQQFDRSSAWLLSLAHRVKPDLIHLNGYWHAALHWNAPVVAVAHSCLFSWWEAVKHEPYPLWFSSYRDRVIDGLRRAHVVVAPSRAMLAEIERCYGPPECSRVIANGRSAQLFPPGKKEEIVLATGRLWDEGKNIETLSRIAGRLPWPVYVAGDAAHPSAGRPSLKDIVLLGKLSPDQLAPWFSRAAIYASPARYEPFGLGVLEAALAGCAMVLSDIASFRENWDGAASFIASDDAYALRAHIAELIESPPRRRKLAAAAAARALHFSPALMATRYLDAYAQALQRFNASAAAHKERLAQCV